MVIIILFFHFIFCHLAPITLPMLIHLMFQTFNENVQPHQHLWSTQNLANKKINNIMELMALIKLAQEMLGWDKSFYGENQQSFE